jgi:exopolysaccharide production protein ExoZ
VTAKIAMALHIAGAVAIPLHMVAGIGIGLIGYAGLEKPVMRYFHRRKRMAAAALDARAIA